MDREGENREAPGEDWLEIPADLGPENPSWARGDRHPDLWPLVLEARGVPHRSIRGFAGRRLLVPAERFDEAMNELRLFEKENRNWPPAAPRVRPLTENTVTTLSVLVLLATFHNITLLDTTPFGHARIDWLSLGSADSAKILDGQWWRTVTALTLHADWVHLSGNLVIGGIFIVLLCRDLGSGLAWALLLGSGILGNLVNAFLQPGGHNSIGASTVVFGAVGILAAVSLVRHRHSLRGRLPLPIAAAMGLLALLGTEGEHTDLGAHLFGFVFGMGLGLAAEYLTGWFGRPGRGLNALLSLLCIMVVVSAWWAAIRFNG